MKNSKDFVYINKGAIILASTLIVFPILCGIPLLFLKQYFELVAILVISTIFLILSIIIRKQLFAKIQFDGNGIYRIYRNKIINFINWNDLTEIQIVPKHHIVFLTEHKTRKEISNNYKYNVMFYLSDKGLKLIRKYKKHIKVSIVNHDKLTKYEKDIFQL